MPTIPNRKRRSRTGCLTCRARHVKCDEQTPECRRCVSANVACAGYEQPAIIAINPQDRARRQRQTASSTALSPSRDLQRVHTPVPGIQTDPASLSSGSPLNMQSGMQTTNVLLLGDRKPLIGFPSSPHPSQCPSLGARHVLGYHQVLLRTIPLLFPPRHLAFWRDELIQEAWGCEYLYLILVALGISHRAALMTAAGSQYDGTNGLDMKITAVQIYTEALQELAKHLEEAKQDPRVLVASLCLMAFFESFSGNLPAFIGRFQAADHYFSTLLQSHVGSDGNVTSRTWNIAPLQDCLRSLSQICYVALPLEMIYVGIEQHVPAFNLATEHSEPALPTILAALADLVDMISGCQEIKEIVWSPISAYTRTISAPNLKDFERRLIRWRNDHLDLIPELDTDCALDALLVYRWSQFAIPPPPYVTTTRNKSLAAAHFNFYRARIKWALILLEDDVLKNVPMAEFYFYEALRHAASHATFLTVTDRDEKMYIPCEALNFGLLPVLHMIGLCSPEPRWLDWVKDLSGQIIQEGVLKGHTFATNLDCLHKFEMHRCGGESIKLEQYPVPAERVICHLIPETDGCHFTSFFAAPSVAYDTRYPGLDAYQVIGYARWKCGYEEGPCVPFLNMFNNDSPDLESFTTEWLYSTQPALDWISRTKEKVFHMDRALQDHISGTRLLLAADSGMSND